MTHKRHCKVCGREFHTVRYKNRYCSSNCLKKAKEFKYEVPKGPQDDGTPYLSALMYNKVCPTCGKEFTAKKKNTKFCSHQCAKLYRMHAEEQGSDIVVIDNPEKFFCKDTGKVIYRKLCANCGIEFQAQHVNTKFCSQSCARKFSQNQQKYKKQEFLLDELIYANVSKRISSYQKKQYLRLSEASELLGISCKTIRRYVNDGSLPSIRTKGVILVPSSALSKMYINTVKSTGKSDKSSADYSPRLHQYFSITEAASAFNINRSTIEHYFRKRKLKHIKVGHTRYFLYSDINKLLEDFRPNQYTSIKHWYTVEDIMRIYNMDRKQVYWFTENHKIPHKKAGKKACYSKVHVDKIKGPSLFDRTQYYQPDEICQKYNLSKDRMYHIVNMMQIPNIRFGREVWILKSAFDSVIA